MISGSLRSSVSVLPYGSLICADTVSVFGSLAQSVAV